VTARVLAHDWYPQALPENVALGDGTWLYSSFAFAHFYSRRPMAVRTGRACGIYNGCFFDLGESGEVAIGDFSTLVGVIVRTNGRVKIGSYCFLAHEIVIADRHAPALTRAEDSDFDSVVLGDDVWVGAGSVLLKGARIGDGAIVGAASVVDFDVPENAVVAGNPARIVGYAKQP
jgi:acetyltransferase-like isoleucine patch superfamily enzyme